MDLLPSYGIRFRFSVQQCSVIAVMKHQLQVINIACSQLVSQTLHK